MEGRAEMAAASSAPHETKRPGALSVSRGPRQAEEETSSV